jgi:hypothetical protein
MKNWVLYFLLMLTIPAVAQDDDDDDHGAGEVIANPYAFLDELKQDRKKVYNIVYILPIRDIKTNAVQRDALAYWEGVNVAMTKIKKLNAKFKIHVWDNQKSDSVTKSILDQLENMYVDAIVAPFHTKQALIVAEYCKNNRIPMFLPQNPSDIIAKNNPFVFKLHTSKNRLFYDIYHSITENAAEKESEIFYVYDNENKAERKMANYLKYASEKDGTNRIKFVPIVDSINFAKVVVKGKKNVFLITQYKENQINDFLASLKSINEAIQVYGHSSWANSNKINKENLAALNASLHTDFFLRKNSSDVDDIKKKYFELTTDDIPSEAFLGYDLANYITTVLDLYGKKFPVKIDKYTFKGTTTIIDMRPLYDASGRLLFYENTHKDILKAFPEGWFKIND